MIIATLDAQACSIKRGEQILSLEPASHSILRVNPFNHGVVKPGDLRRPPALAGTSVEARLVGSHSHVPGAHVEEGRKLSRGRVWVVHCHYEVVFGDGTRSECAVEANSLHWDVPELTWEEGV